MENKINIAELLKDCPQGMELYSPMYGIGKLTKITNKIYVKFPKEHNVKCFRLDGKVSEEGEIMLFPKGKTTWDGFQKPFKDGDIVATIGGIWIGITVGGVPKEFIPTYCVITSDNKFEAYFDTEEAWSFDRLATEEEKQKLFQAIKDNGYEWNTETNTFEKLPKFKDRDMFPNTEDDVRRRSTIQVLEYARSIDAYNQFGKADIDKNIAWLEKKINKYEGEYDTRRI